MGQARLSIVSVGAVADIDQEFQAAGASGQRHFTGAVDVDNVLSPGESLSAVVFRNGTLGSPSLNFRRGVPTGYLVDASS